MRHFFSNMISIVEYRCSFLLLKVAAATILTRFGVSEARLEICGCEILEDEKRQYWLWCLSCNYVVYSSSHSRWAENKSLYYIDPIEILFLFFPSFAIAFISLFFKSLYLSKQLLSSMCIWCRRAPVFHVFWMFLASSWALLIICLSAADPLNYPKIRAYEALSENGTSYRNLTSYMRKQERIAERVQRLSISLKNKPLQAAKQRLQDKARA